MKEIDIGAVKAITYTGDGGPFELDIRLAVMTDKGAVQVCTDNLGVIKDCGQIVVRVAGKVNAITRNRQLVATVLKLIDEDAELANGQQVQVMEAGAARAYLAGRITANPIETDGAVDIDGREL